MGDSALETALHPGDFAVIAVYFASILFLGLWTSRKNRGSAGGYFLAGRSMNWIPVGASLFASNIGSIHFVGLAGSGAAAGIAIGIYELNAMYVLMILAYIFLPVYVASGVFTIPEYLKLRFGGKRIQIYLAILSLLVYIFTKISADLYAGAIFIEQSLNWSIYWSMLLLLGIAAIFTITGGLTAVIWTDFGQTIIMLAGGFVLMVLAFIRVGGFDEMVAKFPDSMSNFTLYSNTSCGRPKDDYMHLFRDPSTGDLPWPGIIGVTINSIWYWCSDQVIVQRALAGKTFDHAKAGTILCAYIKILPLFLLVFPGMISRILFPETVGCADPELCKEICGSESGCSNIAYPTLVINLMPAGARGLMLAVMLSALMSSLTSIFNSSSTIFAMDLWTHIRKQASELEVMIVGRFFVVVLVVISIIWVPVLRASQGAQLYVYIQAVSSFLQPPICCVFLLAVFWSRLNEKGAFSALLVGLLLGLARFIVEYSYPKPQCTENIPDPAPSIVKDFHYLYFSAFLFCVTGVVAIVISLLTKPIDERCLHRLTYWTRHSKEPRLDINSLQYSDSSSSVSTSDKSENVELEKFKVKVSDPIVESGDVVVESGCGDGKNNEEKVSLTHTDKWTDGKELPVVVIEDQSNLIISNVPCYRKVVNWICGIDNATGSSSIANKQVEMPEMLSIKEDRRWKIVSNTAAVIAMMVVIALCIVFDEPRSERTSSGFLTRCDTNQAVQSQKMARSLKFRI